MKKLSVLVPVYNVEKYLVRCINSLKNQTYKNLELVFVDDKSTDNSLELLKQETKGMENVIILEHETNKGLFWARFTAMQNCTGEYMAFLDSDDYLDDNYYEVYMNAILKEDADVCLCEHRGVSEDGSSYYYEELPEPLNLSGEDCLKFLYSYEVAKYGFVTLWSRIIKKQFFLDVEKELEQIVPELKNVIMGEDHLYGLILCSKAQKVVSAKGSYYNYYRHEGQSVSPKNKEKMLDNLETQFRCNVIARKYAQKHGLYDKFLGYDEWWLTNTISENFKYALKFKCLNEFEELLKKYNIDKILKVIQFAKSEFTAK